VISKVENLPCLRLFALMLLDDSSVVWGSAQRNNVKATESESMRRKTSLPHESL
jgi:hypothetical protein